MSYSRGPVILIVGLILGLLTPAASASSASFRWLAERYDAPEGGLVGAQAAVACTGYDTCVIADAAGDVAAARGPEKRRPWQLAHVDGSPLSALACFGPMACVTLDRDGALLTSNDVLAGASSWQAGQPTGTTVGNGPTGLTCVSARLCLAWGTSGRGTAEISTDPAGGATTWRPVLIDRSEAPCGTTEQPTLCMGDIVAIKCLSATHCVAIDDNGDVSVSSGPATIAASWRPVRITSHDTTAGYDPLQALACPSTRACFAGDFSGHLAILGHPTAPPRAWHSTLFADVGYGGGLSALSCASAERCVGVFGSFLLVTTNATQGVRAWKTIDVGARTGNTQMKLLCRARLGCLVFDGTGSAYSSTALTSARRWRRWRVPGASAVAGLTCVSARFCVAATDAGKAIVAINRRPHPGTVGAIRSAQAQRARRAGELESKGVAGVSFGLRKAVVVTRLERRFGTPTGMTGNPGCGPAFSEVDWGELVAEFRSGTFTGYRYLNRPASQTKLAAQAKVVPRHPALSTSGGITLGDSLDRLHRVYRRLSLVGADRYKAPNGLVFVDNAKRSPASARARIIEIRTGVCGNY